MPGRRSHGTCEGLTSESLRPGGQQKVRTAGSGRRQNMQIFARTCASSGTLANFVAFRQRKESCCGALIAHIPVCYANADSDGWALYKHVNRLKVWSCSETAHGNLNIRGKHDFRGLISSVNGSHAAKFEPLCGTLFAVLGSTMLPCTTRGVLFPQRSHLFDTFLICAHRTNVL